MLEFIWRRLSLMLVSLAGVISLTFLLVHIVPGDPVELMLGEQAPAADKDRLRNELGLLDPLPIQFGRYLANLGRLDLGKSLRTRFPVFEEIAEHFPATAELALASLTLALLWGLPLGVWSAVGYRTWRDRLATTVALVGMSVPGVFLGPLLIYFFAIRLDWLPVSDRGGIEHLILPALSLALPLGAVISRMTKASVLEVLREDYMRTARAKGVGTLRLYFHHALRNALVPIVTIVGLQLGALLTGTVITETVFDWPGVGTLLFSAIQSRDYPLVQGCVLFVACIYVLVNLATDILYGVVNPRARGDRA